MLPGLSILLGVERSEEQTLSIVRPSQMFLEWIDPYGNLLLSPKGTMSQTCPCFTQLYFSLHKGTLEYPYSTQPAEVFLSRIMRANRLPITVMGLVLMAHLHPWDNVNVLGQRPMPSGSPGT